MTSADEVGRRHVGGLIGGIGGRGAWTLRHVRAGQFVVQEEAEIGEREYRNVKGTENRIGLMTRHQRAPRY